MKGALVVCDQIDGRKAAALVVDGRLDDLIVDPMPGTMPLPGTIFRAVADRPAKGQGGQFVKLPAGASGFLRQGKGPKPGQPLLVQVTGFAEAGKAIPVSQKLLFKGRYVIVTPGSPGVNVSRRIRDEDRREALIALVARACPETSGVILRSSAETAYDDVLIAELKDLHANATGLAEQVKGVPELIREGPDAHRVAYLEWPGDHSGPDGFTECGIDDLIDAAKGTFVDLSGDASAWIEPTRALVAIDVNTGGDTSPAAGLKANIALSRDLPRQLRCRGLGGQIVIDFAPFPKRDRRTLEQVLRAAFKADTIETALVGWTPLGHFELQRKRERLPLL